MRPRAGVHVHRALPAPAPGVPSWRFDGVPGGLAGGGGAAGASHPAAGIRALAGPGLQGRRLPHGLHRPLAHGRRRNPASRLDRLLAHLSLLERPPRLLHPAPRTARASRDLSPGASPLWRLGLAGQRHISVRRIHHPRRARPHVLGRGPDHRVPGLARRAPLGVLLLDKRSASTLHLARRLPQPGIAGRGRTAGLAGRRSLHQAANASRVRPAPMGPQHERRRLAPLDRALSRAGGTRGHRGRPDAGPPASRRAGRRHDRGRSLRSRREPGRASHDREGPLDVRGVPRHPLHRALARPD